MGNSLKETGILSSSNSNRNINQEYKTGNIKVSVIVPVYNVEKYLKRCLDSIINQTLKDIEIICVNDGSTDGSFEILKEYSSKNSNIKIINKQNEGLSCARNDAMKIARGEYIGFVDSDDYIDLNFFEKLYLSAKKNDADIAFCGIKRVSKYSKRYKLSFKEEKIYNTLKEKLSGCNIPECCYVWNKIYKTDKLLNNNIYFEPNVYYEDRCFTAQVLINLKKAVSVPDIYYNYYKNKDSIVQRKTNNSEIDSIYTFGKMLKLLQSYGVELLIKTKKYRLFGLTIFKIRYYVNRKTIIFFNLFKITVKK